jgi:hypothetical protein
MLTVDGRKGKEEDVLLNLVAGHVDVVSAKGGSSIRSLPYARIVRATCVYANKPTWDPGVSSPPADLQVPGVFLRRDTRRWLVLQTRTEYLILHLSNDDWRRVVAAVESRTGLTVDQRTSAQTSK